MTNFYSGVAGARGCNPKGVVIHNDAGSQGANASFYRNWLPTHPAENGFAHYYVASDGIYQAEAETNMAWHTANATGNAYYIGIEACQSQGDVNVFRDNERRSIELAATILKRYGLPADANTVMLHREFVSTSCPHRSWELHGKSVAAVKAYFIQEIKKYMGGATTNNTNNNTQNTNTNTNKKDDEIMFKYIKVQKNGSKEQWLAYGNKRMYLPTQKHADNADLLLKRTGHSTKAEEYSHDNYALKMIEKSTDLVKL